METKQSLMVECWCRDLSYIDVVFYANKFNCDIPTQQEYTDVCNYEDKLMEEHFKKEHEAHPEKTEDIF